MCAARARGATSGGRSTSSAGAPAAGDPLAAWVQREEGFRGHVYLDHLGHPTIGFGWALHSGISREEAAAVLRLRLDRVEREVLAALPWAGRLDGVRLGVLTAMAFQLGVAGLLRFRATLRAVEARDYAGAATQMLRSLWAQQTPQRAARTAEAMRTGEWPAEVQ